MIYYTHTTLHTNILYRGCMFLVPSVTLIDYLLTVLGKAVLPYWSTQKTQQDRCEQHSFGVLTVVVLTN